MRGKGITSFMVVSALSCLIWIGGLGWTLMYYFGTAPDEWTASAVPSKESQPAAAPVTVDAAAGDQELRVLSLGDSLSRGTGDAGGKGYVGILSEQLKERVQGQELMVTNRGVNGLTSVQLLEQLKREEQRSEVEQADVLLLSIGGNDLFRSGETLLQLDLAKVKEMEAAFQERLQAILSELRGINSGANVYVIGLYNPFIEQKDSVTTTRIVRDWNYKVSETAASFPKIVVVPTFDLFQLKVQDYLAPDQFHPNEEGYRRIGDRLAALVTWQEGKR